MLIFFRKRIDSIPEYIRFESQIGMLKAAHHTVFSSFIVVAVSLIVAENIETCDNQRVQTVNRTSQHRGIYKKFTVLYRCRYFLLLTLHFVYLKKQFQLRIERF